MLNVKFSLFTLAVLLASPAYAEPFGPCALELSVPGFATSSCAKSKVPLDHAASLAGNVELAVRKFAVADSVKRRGQIWLIHGGPGESGAGFYPLIEVFEAAFEGFDLMVPDHRGTGESTRLCPVEESIESDAGYAMANSEWGPCIGSLFANPARTKAFSITNAAYDLAALMAQYREPGEVYIYAVSYGTQLTLRLMQVAPPKLDGIIFDGLVPPEAEPKWDLSYRTAIVDRVGRSLLNTQQIERFQTLLASEQQFWLEVLGGADIRQFMAALLSFPVLRSRIPDIIDALALGKTELLSDTLTALTAAHDDLMVYPQSVPSLPLVMLISNSENNSRRDLTAEVVATEAKDALFISPLPGLLVHAAAPFYDRDEYFGRVPEHLPRTLIIHGTLDPNTPYEGAKAHADLLHKAGQVHFSSVVGGAHFLPMVAAECFTTVAAKFIRNDDIPAFCDALTTSL